MVYLEIHGFVPRWSRTGRALGKAKINVAEFAREKGKGLKIPIECEINEVRTNAELTVTIEFFDLESRKSPISIFLRGLSFPIQEKKAMQSYHRPRKKHFMAIPNLGRRAEKNIQNHSFPESYLERKV